MTRSSLSLSVHAYLWAYLSLVGFSVEMNNHVHSQLINDFGGNHQYFAGIHGVFGDVRDRVGTRGCQLVVC